MKIYVDGVLKNSISSGAVANNVSNIKVHIGGAIHQVNTPIYLYKGELDEIRVWNVARTATQIQQSFITTLQGNESGLVAYYDFNQGTPAGNNTAITSIVNTVNSASNGTLTNFTKTGTTSNFIGNTTANISISGASNLCANATSQFTHIVAGGTWSVSSGAAATVSTSGLVTTLGAESMTISYLYTVNGCSFTAAKAVAIVAPAITAQPSTTAQNVCINGITATIAVTATGSGITYQWYRNTSATNTGGTLISGATNSVFMPSNTLVGTTYYYCVVSSTCSSPITSSVSGAITIAPASAAGTITGTASICSGATTTLTLSGNVGSVQWQLMDSTVWTNIAGATTTTFTTPALTQNTTYRAVVTSGVCSAVNTANFNVVVNPLPVISGTTSVGAGESVTLTATTTAASSNAWVSSTPAVASVSNTGVINGLMTGTTTITYTNSNGCTDTEIITVEVGTTQAPVLTLPATNTTGATTLNFNYTLPEIPLAGSVRLTFTPVGGGAQIIWTMTNATSAVFSYVVGTNPTTISNVVSGAALGFTTYDVTLAYQDSFSNPSATVTNTNVQTLAPPSISFANTTYNEVINVSVSIQTINTGGAMETYSITPSLPAGLTLNTTTGLISGVPTSTLALTTFIVTVTNAAGTDTESFTLFIDADTDGDGIGNTTDPDIDGDGTLNGLDTNPTNPCLGFNANTASSSWQTGDCDGDGIQNGVDNCPTIVNTSIVTQPSTQTVNSCLSTVPFTLTVVSAGQQLTYQWYSNTSNSNVGGTVISGATTATYVPTTSYVSRYYYVVVSGTCGTVTSNVSGAITINPTSLPGSIAGATSVCSGTNSTVLTLSGNTGTIQWQSSTDNISFTNITGATASTFTATNLTAPTHYRVVVNSGVCSLATTASVTITVSPISVAGSIAGATSVCSGTNTTVLTLSGNTGTIQWQSSTDNITFTTIASATASTYTATNITATTYYRAIVTSGVCSSATTASVTITVSPTSLPGSIAGATSVCSGTNSTVLTLSGNTGTIQWQWSTDNVTFFNIPSATTSTYTASNITVTTYYRAVVTSGVCSSATTTVSTITVNPTSVAGSIAGAATVCSGTNATVLTLSGNTGTIQWQSSTNNVAFTTITGATASTFTATNLTVTTYYRAVITSGVCASATTASVTITVNPTSVAGSIAGATTVCSATNSTVLTLSGNTGTIQWQSSTDNSTFTTITGATASTYTATNITATTYYRALVTSGICSSATTVVATITNIPIVAPTAVSNQQFCYLNNPTISNLVTTSGVGIKWYSNATGGIPLIGLTPLTTATTYYASQTISVCESPTRVVVTVLLSCPVDAIADNFGSINGYAGATTASVLANDTINGGLLLPSQVILTGVTVPTGLTLNANGTITIAPQTAAGTYNVTYRICELLNPTNCDTVTFSIIVGACLDFAINDCDLDGESNGIEAANGTNPSDVCSYTNPPASNNVVYPTWSVLDCDGDGVINGQEITDGTSPINPCSSNPINITVPLSTSFLNGDCDNDGLLNGEEMGSNVNYPNDSNGNGIPDYLEVNNHTVSEDNLEVYSSLTPNGDGNNDVFIIRNIENYPENNVSIFNRWGIIVYDVDGYGQNNKYFKGISEGRITINSQDELPVGTYFYIIKYKNNNGEQKQRSGYLYINR
jgi:gliding motility-associated-like protein